MARKTLTTTTTEIQPPSGQIVMPDPDSFAAPAVSTDPEEKIGRARGIDYEQWAVATIDLTGDPSRITSARLRLQGKGYQRVEGQVVINGFTAGEAWVIPRKMHEERLAARHRKIVGAVENGTMTEFALDRSVITRAR